MIPNCKKLYLCSVDKQPLYMLNGLRTESVSFHPQIKGYSELSFTVDRFVSIDGQYVESNGYNDLLAYMYIYLEDIGYFQMQAPEVVNDGNNEHKEIECYSAEKEFENKDYVGIKINAGTKDSIEYLAPNNVDELGFAKQYVTMFNDDNHDLSFLHIILDKMAGRWSIGDVDSRIANAQIPKLEIDNENLYAIMTSEVGPRLSCLFVFNYLTFQVSVYHKDSLDGDDFDTGIFIGYKNLAQEVSITVDQDSIFTRFNVEGNDGLKIQYYNYGDNRIINLDYFMKEPFMSEELADKIADWQDLRDTYVNEYVDIALEYSQVLEEQYQKKYAVPSDETYWRNWDNMREDGLRENLEYFTKFLERLQEAVDDRSDDVKYPDGIDGPYSPKMIGNEVDHDWYLQKLHDQMGEYSGYYTYQEIITYILPYINMAIDNLDRRESEKVVPDTDASEDWSLYGYEELEGVRKSYEEDLKKSLEKYSLDWDDMTEEQRKENGLDYGSEEKYEQSAGRMKYVHYCECLYGIGGDADNPIGDCIYNRLADLKEEIDNLQNQLDELSATLGEYNNIMKYDITDYSGYTNDDGEYVQYTRIPQSLLYYREECGFTEQEIDVITTLLHDTDYVNSNILTTSIMSTSEKMGKQLDLLNDAKEKLSEVSQPQYKFSVSLDNFLRLVDYQSWVDKFVTIGSMSLLLKFIYLGIHDDETIRVRVIGMTWNPCEVTPDLQLEFSNMISSRSGRSDLVQLLDMQNNSGSKNSISIGTGNSNSDKEYIDSLLQVLTKNTIFTKAVSNISSNTTGTLDTATVQSLFNDFTGTLDLSNISVKLENIQGNDSTWRNVFTEYLDAGTIYAKFGEMEQADIKELSTQIITFGEDSVTRITGEYLETAQIKASSIVTTDATFENLVADIIRVGEDGITRLTEDTISTATINASQINGETGDFQVLTANIFNVIDPTDPDDPGTQIIGSVINTTDINASHIVGQQGDFDNLTASIFNSIDPNNPDDPGTQVIGGLISTSTILASQIDSTEGSFVDLAAQILSADQATFHDVMTDTLTAHDISATLATISQIDAVSLFSNNVFANSIQSIASTTTTSTVNSEYVLNLVAGRLVADDITSGNITLSEDVKILSDNGKMIMDGQRLQILGTDSEGNDYVGVQLGYDTNNNPSLILRNEDGAVLIDPTGLKAEAIVDGLLVNDMLANGTIQKAKLGFNVAEADANGNIQITHIYDGVDSFGALYASFKSTTETTLSNLDSKIESSVSYSLYIETPQGTNTMGGNIVLSARLFKNSVDVTSQYDDSYFIWTRTSKDSNADTVWNNLHSNGTKTLTITSADINISADFHCKFEIGSVSVTT